MSNFFKGLEKISYEGPDSNNPLAFHHYDPEEMVLGKPMKEQLRFAVAYWHSFAWPGTDPFGGPTFQRPWFDLETDGSAKDAPMAAARLKAEIAFELFDILDVPYFCFHDADMRPEGETLAKSIANLNTIADLFEKKMSQTGTKLLWGTANLFSHRRFMAGAATNPDPDIFAYAGATIKANMDVTHRLGGENYVLWGGREGYETLLNTSLFQELDQMGRMLALVVDYKHKVGFSGTILLEPKPREPSKHQYDYDVSTVYGFLKKYGLENEVKVNIEVGHAILAGHTFEHEVAMANAHGIFGSIDMNRNDYQSGWDTDQFPNNVPEVMLAYYHILKAGGFDTGGTNFDAKLRRQSIEPVDLVQAHIGGMDVCARGLKAAAALIEDGACDGFLAARYKGWDSPWAQRMLAGELSLDQISRHVLEQGLEPDPVSGQQEYLENLINRFV